MRRLLELRYEQLVQTFTITSYAALPVTLTLGLKIGADFCDLFEVRGAVRKQRGQQRPPERHNTLVTLGYEGIDEVVRETRFEFTPPIEYLQGDDLFWRLRLMKSQPIDVQVVVKLSSSDLADKPGLFNGNWLNVLELHGIQVGDDSAHLRFVRSGSGDRVEVVLLEGNEVEVRVI